MPKARKSTRRKSSTDLMYKKFDMRIVISFLVLFGVVGGYFIWQTFAYSYDYCRKPGYYNRVNQYDSACLRDSDEAKVIRLYYSTLAKAPNSTERDLAVKMINGSNSTTLSMTQLASELMKNSSYKTKFDSLNNDNFVKQIYAQALGRPPSNDELVFVKAQIGGSTVDHSKRAATIASLSESNENKTNSEGRVMSALGVQLKSSSYKKASTSTPVCLGTTQTEGGATWCNVKIKDILLNKSTGSSTKHLGLVRIPKTFTSTASSPVVEMNIKLRNTSVQLGTNVYQQVGGISLIPYSGTLGGSTDFTTTTYPSYSSDTTISSSETNVYANASKVPKGTTSLLLSYSASTYGDAKTRIESLPDNALISVKMPSIEFYTSTNTSDSRIPQDQAVKKYATHKPVTYNQLTVQGKSIGLPAKVAYTPISKKSGNTDWAHTTRESIASGKKVYFRVSGTSAVVADRASAHRVKFKVRVYRNGKSVSTSDYRVYVQKNYAFRSDDKNVKLSRDKSGYYSHKDYDWDDQFTVSINQKSSGKLKVVFDVVSPSYYKFTDSYFNPYEFRP